MSCAAALENIDIIERENMLAHARDVAPYFMEQLETLADLPLVAVFVGAIVSAILSRSDSILLAVASIVSINLLPLV